MPTSREAEARVQEAKGVEYSVAVAAPGANQRAALEVHWAAAVRAEAAEEDARVAEWMVEV